MLIEFDWLFHEQQSDIVLEVCLVELLVNDDINYTVIGVWENFFRLKNLRMLKVFFEKSDVNSQFECPILQLELSKSTALFHKHNEQLKS